MNQIVREAITRRQPAVTIANKIITPHRTKVKMNSEYTNDSYPNHYYDFRACKREELFKKMDSFETLDDFEKVKVCMQIIQKMSEGEI